MKSETGAGEVFAIDVPSLPEDTAKISIEEDELGRAPFAEKIAQAIAKTPTTSEALIVALYGGRYLPF